MTSSQRPSFPPEVLAALKRGNKIEAVKLLRQAAKVGLAEAKSAVDGLERARASVPPKAAAPRSPASTHAYQSKAAEPHLLRRPGLSPGEVPRESSGAGWIILLLGGVLLASWLVR